MQNSRLTQRQEQKQKLTSQQIQSIELLSLPVVDLEQRVKEEIERNIVLEEEPQETSEGSPSVISVDDYIHENESSTAYFRPRISNEPGSISTERVQAEDEETVYEIVEKQLGYLSLPEDELSIARFIVRSTDADGYLRRDSESISYDLLVKQGLDIPAAEIDRLTELVQKCDPQGFCSRSPKEFMLIQLSSKHQSDTIRDAILIVGRYFDAFSSRRYEFVMESTGMTPERFRDAVDEIQSLYPRPSDMFQESGSSDVPYVIPDFTISLDDDRPKATLNSYYSPRLRVNRDYLKSSEQTSSASGTDGKQAEKFVRKSISDAEWFIQAIRQREKTLKNVMAEIMNAQKEYFLTGNESDLKPMTMKDIAQTVGMDISTISRVVNSKYALAPWGLIHLKSLFSDGIADANGNEVSTRLVQNVLKEIISAEDTASPLTDEQLQARMEERGYPIARRTIAKYRDALGIPVARLRKEIGI